MTEVFIVRGVAGEYSDRCEWSVVAFLNEGAARAEVERLSVAWRTLKTSVDLKIRARGSNGDYDHTVRKAAMRLMERVDPGFHSWGDEPRYHLEKCPLIAATA